MRRFGSFGSTPRSHSSSKGTADQRESPGPWHEFLEHTSELELQVRAPSWATLLSEAGRALSDVLLRGAAGQPDARVKLLSVSASDREALLVDWLNEILYVAETERWIPVQFEVVELSDTHVKARVRGIPVSETPSLVKATTHHGLRVRESDGMFHAEVIFDV